MNTTTILIIVYIVSVILSNLFAILHYKNEVRQGKFLMTKTPTIGHFMKHYSPVCIINFIPIVNFISIIIIGGSLLWDKIKNVKL